MKFHLIFPMVSLLALAPVGVFGQNAQPNQRVQDSEIGQRFWIANLPGGSFTVALDKISSVAKQTYILDSNLMIYEVTLETSGAALTRFYFITPIAANSASRLAQNTVQRANELLNMASSRAGAGSADELVIKQYPTTSHAKTIEYRLAASEEIDAIYSSLQKAWTSGKGRTFTIKSSSK